MVNQAGSGIGTDIADTGNEALGYDEIQRLDFQRPERIAKATVRSLSSLHNAFLKGISGDLAAYLRTPVEASLVSIAQLPFESICRSMVLPACLVSMRCAPFGTRIILDLGTRLALVLLELAMGGAVREDELVEREITDIEKGLLDGVLARVARSLSTAWKSIDRIEFAVDSVDGDPSRLTYFRPGEPVVNIVSDMRLAGHSFPIGVVLPSMLAKRAGQKTDTNGVNPTETATHDRARRMMSLLRQAPVELEAKLEGGTLSAAELLRLKPGDVVRLDHASDRPAILSVAGVPRMLGRLISTRGRKSVLLEKLAEPAEAISEREREQ